MSLLTRENGKSNPVFFFPRKSGQKETVVLPGGVAPLLFNIHDTGRGAVKTQNLVKISPGGMLFKKHLQKIMNRVYILSQGKQLLKSRQKTTLPVT